MAEAVLQLGLQVAREAALARELEDVIKQFQSLTNAQLPGINSALAAKNLPPIQVISEADWQKANNADGSGGAGGQMSRAGNYEGRRGPIGSATRHARPRPDAT